MEEKTKAKLLYILELLKKTDEQHPVNTNDIIAYLEEKGLSAERKSVARDVEAIRQAGYSIILCDEYKRGYYMTDQTFEDYELKMIADAVSEAKFLTYGDSETLVNKLCEIATYTGEEIIKEGTFIDPTIKSKNKFVRFNIDRVINAIKQKKRLTFQYYEIGPDGNMRLKRDGHIYEISPYYLCWAEDGYFLIGNSKSHDHLTHFRVDMMVNVEITKIPIRQREEIEELTEDFSIGEYLRQNVNMYTGDLMSVTLECRQNAAPDFRTRFGTDIKVVPIDDEHFRADVTVTKGEGFIRWIMQFDPDDIKVIWPSDFYSVIEKRAKKISKCYK